MIQPNELRIGNRVFWNKEKSLYYTINMEDFSSLFVFDIIEPIPLTPEILEKCGFSVAYNHINGLPMPYSYDTLKLQGILFEFSDNGYLVKTRQKSKLTCIKYIHQLQNLYFALTGEELTFKP